VEMGERGERMPSGGLVTRFVNGLFWRWVALFACKQGRRSRMEADIMAGTTSEHASTALRPPKVAEQPGPPREVANKA